MAQEDIRALVRRLSRDHKNDRDGGRALVWALKQAHRDLGVGDRADFIDLLTNFVRVQDPELWAVALETLVQLGESEDIAALASELIESVPDEGRKDYVVLGLLRLSPGHVVQPIVEHIRAALRNPRPLTMSMTAALCKVDKETGLELAAAYFEAAHADPGNADFEGQLATFVRNLVQIEERLLPEFVRRVMLRSPGTGRWLARCIREYLSTPWMLEDLGGERCRNLREKIGASEHTLN